PPRALLPTLGLHDALPISAGSAPRQLEINRGDLRARGPDRHRLPLAAGRQRQPGREGLAARLGLDAIADGAPLDRAGRIVARLGDRKSTRLNSSHQIISYA